MKSQLKQKLGQLQCPEADMIGLRWIDENTTVRMVRNEKPESSYRDRTTGVMIEVLFQGQIAYASTADDSIESLQESVNAALAQAKSAASRSVHQFSLSARPKSVGKFSRLAEIPFSQKTAGEVMDFLTEISRDLKVSPQVVRSEAMARSVETHMIYLTNQGADIEQKMDLISTYFSATAVEGNLTQRRTDRGPFAPSFQGGWEHLYYSDVLENARRIGEEAVELLGAEECPSGKMDVIIMPDQMMLQIHESIGHPLELDRILGDERNYAGSSFVKKEDFGNLQYGSPLLNVTFDPRLDGEFACFRFDDCGAPANKEYLIQKGKLLRGLGGLESQERIGVPGVATTRSCSWNRPPIDRISNINVEPGASTLDEMIESIEEGVMMDANRAWSIDDFRRKFQFGCEYGKRIKNGKVVATIRNPGYRGITVPFWTSLKAVGNDQTREVYGTPYCGKGEPNQVIRVGHASPACLFENLEVFGSESL